MNYLLLTTDLLTAYLVEAVVAAQVRPVLEEQRHLVEGRASARAKAKVRARVRVRVRVRVGPQP